MCRAIVGQLLDHAANGAAYWSVEGIKHALPQQWGGPENAQEKLDAFLESANLQEDDF